MTPGGSTSPVGLNGATVVTQLVLSLPLAQGRGTLDDG